MLVDSKLWPQESDFEMYNFITELEIPVLIVLSKSDKLSKSELNKSLDFAEKNFFWEEIIAVSVKNKLWIFELEKILKNSLIK